MMGRLDEIFNIDKSCKLRPDPAPEAFPGVNVRLLLVTLEICYCLLLVLF